MNREAPPSDEGLAKIPSAVLATLSRVAEEASATGQTQWVARTEPAEDFDPVACYASCADSDRFYWERASANQVFVASGRVDEIESAGSARFEDVARWASTLRGRLHWIGEERPRTAPLFLGGFGFRDESASLSEWKSFPAARFILPATIVERFGEEGPRRVEIVRVEPGGDAEGVFTEWQRREQLRAALLQTQSVSKQDFDERGDVSASGVTAWPSGPEYRVQSDRPHQVFTDQVAQALSEIEAGHLEKVVLARSLEVEHDGELEVPVFLTRLREMYPTCTLVAIGRGEDTLLAATPETLIRVRGDEFETVALAGSAPRGRTPEEDADLAAALQASPKERAEHGHVVDAIRAALAPHCASITAAESPELRAIFGIQHLETPISGQLESSKGVLGLVADLHPTPAVGGVPREAAVEWLQRYEGLDRGWYAAPIGWLDGDEGAGGGGDFSVALRSALIRCGEVSGKRASRAWLYAGAGVVDGSVPAQELDETRVKLRALLAPLTEI